MKRRRLEHANKDRAWGPAEIHNAQPDHKSHRIYVPEKTQKIADELYRLKTLFALSDGDLGNIVRNVFNAGFGARTLSTFLDRVHGVGFNPRPKTLMKINYLIEVLQTKEKEFASS